MRVTSSLGIAVPGPVTGRAPPQVPPWSVPAGELFERTRSRQSGLGPGEAVARLRASLRRPSAPSAAASVARVIGVQLASPLVLLLVFAAAVSAITRDWVDSGLVLAIVVVSVGVSALREYQGQPPPQRSLLASVPGRQ